MKLYYIDTDIGYFSWCVSSYPLSRMRVWWLRKALFPVYYKTNTFRDVLRTKVSLVSYVYVSYSMIVHILHILDK